MANHSKKFNDVRSYYKYHMWKKRQVVMPAVTNCSTVALSMGSGLLPMALSS